MIKILLNRNHCYYRNTWRIKISVIISELLQILTIPVTIQSENFPPHPVAPVTFFSLHKYTQCFSTCSGAWEFHHVECFHAQGHSTTDTRFSDTVKVTAVVKPPFCPLSLFQNYLLHCPHTFNSSAIWPQQYG